jgi:hypothetical protein
MKKIALCVILIFLISCDDKARNFDGIGEIKLGGNFESLSSSKLFKKLSENEYKIDSFKLSNEIGYVKNLVVKLEEGVIYDVSFNNSKTTNISAIDSLIQDFDKYSLIKIAENKSTPIQIVEKSDGDVDFSKMIKKSNPQVIEYRYFDIKKVVNLSDEEE